MLLLKLIYLLNTAICLAMHSEKDSDDDNSELGYGWHNIEQGWDDLLYQEVRDTYLEFVDRISVVVDQSCTICIGSAAATSVKHSKKLMMENIFKDDEIAILEYHEPIIVRFLPLLLLLLLYL